MGWDWYTANDAQLQLNKRALKALASVRCSNEAIIIIVMLAKKTQAENPRVIFQLKSPFCPGSWTQKWRKYENEFENLHTAVSFGHLLPFFSSSIIIIFPCRVKSILLSIFVRFLSLACWQQWGKERESLTFNACSIPSISRAPIPAATVSRTSLQLSSLPFIELPAFSFELCDARESTTHFQFLCIASHHIYWIQHPFEIHNIDPSDAPEVKVFHVASLVVCARGRMCLHGNLLSYFNELKNTCKSFASMIKQESK